MSTSRPTRARGGAVALAGLLALAACGADDATTADTLAPATFQTNDETSGLEVDVAGDPVPAGTDPAPDPAASTPVDNAGSGAPDPTTGEPAAIEAAPPGGRALAAAVAPESEIETNLLPDLVVDDVRRQAKANFRNIFPADRPVLLWMWAPH